MSISDIILCVVLVAVGLAIIWLVVELALTIRKTRATVTDVSEQIKPSIANIEKITTDIQPVIQKVDPLVERVSLTVDAANLEIMRVDEILGDVSKISGSVSKTVGAVDSVTSAPLDLVTTATKKIRQKFSPKYASEESVDLGTKQEGDGNKKSENNPIVQFASAMGSAATETIDERRAQKEAKEELAEEERLKDQAKQEKMDASAEKIIDENAYQITIDTDDIIK